MLSAYFRIYGVSSAQPPDPSPKVSQLQGLPPESSVPGKQGRYCFPSDLPAQLARLCAAHVKAFSSRSNPRE